ncbi:FAD-dependent oxidoreductase, partial [Natronoarchaeum mannanilyticum]
GERAAIDVDAVVFATPPRALERATDYEWAGETRNVLSVLFGLSESLLDAYGLTVADDAPFGRLVEHTNLVPAENYGGDHLLYALAPVTSPRDDRWQRDDETLARRWVEALEGLFPAFDRRTVRWSTVTRARDAGPVYETGYRERTISHDLSDAVAQGCYYAGDASAAQYPTRTVDGAVRAGRRCADLIATSSDD